MSALTRRIEWYACGTSATDRKKVRALFLSNKPHGGNFWLIFGSLGVLGGSWGGHIGSWWALLGVIGLSCGFFSARYRPSVHCTWFLPNFVEFGRLLKNDLGDEKIMMPNNQLLSYLFDYWALVFFEYISVSGVERGSFWSKKKFKKLINKDFRAFFLKTVFIFSRPQFSKIWISETGYGSRLIPRYFRKKMGG